MVKSFVLVLLGKLLDFAKLYVQVLTKCFVGIFVLHRNRGEVRVWRM